MGSAAVLESTPKTEKSQTSGAGKGSGIKSKGRGRPKKVPCDADKMNIDEQVATNLKKKKRNGPENAGGSVNSRKMPKRAAACSDFKEKSARFSESIVETQKEHTVEEEISAIRLTSGPDDPRTNRRLTDFVFHDVDGNAQPFEMLENDDMFITGVVLSLEESSEKKKEKGVRCEGFGRIEEWAISGYEDGSPVIWISTEIADYDCVKPAASYKKYYDLFFEKARACVEVFKLLSKSSRGSLDMSLDELLAGVARSMSGSRSFVGGTSAKDFVVSHGEFIYNQLIGYEQESSKNNVVFADLPVLVSLREECKKRGEFRIPEKLSSNGTLKIKDEDRSNQFSASPCMVEEDEDQKLARLLHEEEYWNSVKQKKNKRQTSGSNKFYIKINEDEIANDYPLPAYYKTTVEETDEYLVFDSDIGICDPDDLPRSMLHNWALYDADSRLTSLELLPMRSCDEDDVTIFGSGTMTEDDGSGFCLDADPLQSSSGSSEAHDTDGIPIYLSAIKEWVIEFGAAMVFISIRTDMAWYRLGKPSKQYAPWYEPVLKTAKLATSIIRLLNEQSRASRLSFVDVIKRVAEFEKNDPAYISSVPAVVERYVVVHGQIILQTFAEYPVKTIKNCSFVSGLSAKMEERHHTKMIVKKKVVLKSESNLNPRASMAPVVSKRKAMQATTTRLINRIWGDYYSNYSPEDPKERNEGEVKDEDDVEEQEENEEEADENVLLEEQTSKPHSASASKVVRSKSNPKGISWDGAPIGKTCSGEALYRKAFVRGAGVDVGGAVTVELEDSEDMPNIYFIEYMFETSDGRNMVHGIVLERGTQTVLGNTANERELFLTNECMEFELGDIKQTVVVDIRSLPWGHQHRKDNALADKIDKQRAEERKRKGLPMEYYCKSLYWPEKGSFLALPKSCIGTGAGVCYSCKMKETEQKKEAFTLSPSKAGFVYRGIEYSINDFVYVSPCHFTTNVEEHGTFKSGRNVGLKSYVVCQLLGMEDLKASKQATPESTKVKVRRFFRPEDISSEKAYTSDIREVYYSEEIFTVPVETIEGKCEIRKKHDLPSLDDPVIFDHIFFCEHLYDPAKGSIKQLPANVKLRFATGKVVPDEVSRKKKGKCKEGESDGDIVNKQEVSLARLATLDIFAGCGGLSEGLQKSGVTCTKWAIEYEEPAGEAFNLNHPDALMFVDNCNVILRAIMEKCGDVDECISTPEASELAAKLGEKKINNLPMPGQVDFINGGPPCQGFSGMNRFNQGTWSKVQCEMILAFLSFADYFRPRYFLLENVRTFVSFNKGQTFRLTLASLLEMGYQVRFGVLDAGAYGVSQSRKRAFIWAASPEETLPDWPEPMHVFAGPELRIALPGNVQYAAVRTTAGGAPFRAITVRDTIGDLPPVGNGASKIEMEYGNEAVSWFQRQIRGNTMVLSDHISKEMNELNLIRCQKIPKRPGADWRDLPDEKVKLSTGQLVALIPWCLPNTAKRHNEWKGLFGRLDWEGNFPTSITDPQPMGKVGMCFHPDQDRILTVRECARSQGFRDSYKFAGIIQNKHRQIGNAVPPPLAFALGKKLKEAVEKQSTK